MIVEEIDLAKLRSPERNARLHPEAQIIELMRAVEMFGQTRPIIVDEHNTVLVGNGLMAALQRMERKRAIITRMTGLTPADKTKLMLSDNKIFSLGIDDYDGIMELIRGIDADSLNIPGFDDDILRSLLSGDNAATDAAMAGFGAMSDDEINARRASVNRNNGESTVTCPHCGKSFVLA